MTPVKLRNALAVPLGQCDGDFIPVPQDEVHFQFRRNGLLQLVQRELKLTPATAATALRPTHIPRGKLTT